MSEDRPSDNSVLGMDGLCRFAGHLAHDLNNLMTPIIACGQMLKDSFNKEDPLYFCAEQIADAGDRLLEFSKKLQIIGSRRSNNQTLDLPSLIHEAVRGVSLPADRAVRVEGPDPGNGDLLVSVDMEQLVYAVTELIHNAIAFMPEGGTVTVAVRGGVTPDTPGAGAENGWVCLSVTDEGTGMDAETQSRMYEPYFSTIGGGKDKGLGLTLVYGIVRRAGGQIECHSAPGSGTSFRLFFPRKADAALG